MTDNYEYNRSMDTQSETDYSPYTDKQYNSYINDINSGVYQNNGLSLVQFDLSSIYNSQKFTDTNDLFVVLPIVMVAAFSTSTAGTLVAPTAGNVNLLSLKNNFIHLIHQADLTINGKTAEDVQPFINIAKHFQMLSEMSTGDLETIGYSIGMTEPDNWKSKVYNGSLSATVTNKSGNGMTNNRPFVPQASFIGGGKDNSTCTANQFDRCVNTSIQHRLGRYTDSTAANVSGMVGATAAFITELTKLRNDYTPTYEVLNTHYMVWYDYAVIKLSTVFESLKSIGLTRKADIFLRLYINTGTLNVSVSSPNTTTPGYSLTTANNSFNATCPFTVNYLCDTSANGGIPGTPAVANITAGLYLVRAPATSYNGINLNNSGANHPLPACRIYYSQIIIQPTLAEEYTNLNRAKKCIYRTVLTNQYNNITAAGNFNQLISSGVVHPTAILIVPYVSSLASFSFGDFAWKSPFDTCPGDAHPLSLTNLQVTIGGQNVLQSVLNYNYETFLEQIMYAEQLTSADFGVTTGLFDSSFWNNNRYYYINVERSNITDKLVARNINISFTNNNNVPIDVLVFTFKSNSLTIDVEDGMVSIP